MSLLNNMLNDLEKRQVTAVSGQPLPETGIQALPPKNKTNSQLMVWVLIIVAAATGAWSWSQFHKPVAHPVPQIIVANSPPHANPAPAQAEPAAPVQQAAESIHKSSKPGHAATQTSKSVQVAITNEQMARDLKTVEQSKPLAEPARSFKVVRPQQQSDNLYRQAIAYLQQSRVAEAQQALRQALDTNSGNHNARLLLADMQVDAGNNAEAVALLKEGLDLAPGNSGFSMALAHLQVAGGAKDSALVTLEKGLASARDDAEYHAFLAAILQHGGHHTEAVQHYLTALRSNPSMPNWLVGVGISLKAEDKMNDAAEAFQRAIDTGELSVEVAQFSDQQLKQIRLQH